MEHHGRKPVEEGETLCRVSVTLRGRGQRYRKRWKEGVTQKMETRGGLSVLLCGVRKGGEGGAIRDLSSGEKRGDSL